MTGVVCSGRAGCSLGLASMILQLWCVSDHRVEWTCWVGTRVYTGWPLDIVRLDNRDWSLTEMCVWVWAVSVKLSWVQWLWWNLTLSVHEWDSCEHQGRLSCTWTAAKVCCNVWVVMHDLQGGSPSGLCLGLSFSVIGFRQSTWRYLGGGHDSGLTHELVDWVVTPWTC